MLPLRSGLFFFTLLFYALSIAGVTLLFVFYTQPGACHEGKVFISLNLTFCVCVSIIAVLPKVQVSLPVSAWPDTRPLGVGLLVGTLGSWGRGWQSQKFGPRGWAPKSASLG